MHVMCHMRRRLHACHVSYEHDIIPAHHPSASRHAPRVPAVLDLYKCVANVLLMCC
jgi:hypothetical protein